MIGFDDSEHAAIVTPPLTTVRQPLAEMGRMAVMLLTRLLEGQRLEALHIELKTRLVLRGSTGTRAGRRSPTRAERASRRGSGEAVAIVGFPAHP